MVEGTCKKMFEDYFDFWEKLTPEQKEFVCQNAVTIKYEKGTAVHRGCNDCIGILLLKSGQLRTYMLSEDGREITLYRLFRGDTCILSASCILKNITFDVFIDAEEETEVLLINSAAFRKLSEENVYVECFSYRLTTQRFSDVMWAMQQILFMSFDRRMAIFLLDEVAKTGGDSVKMTQEQMAKYMGSAREVVSRMLGYFASEGLVELFRGGVRILDKKALRELS